MASPTELLDRLTRGRAERLYRFSSVSAFGVVLTQALLVFLHGVLDLDAAVANVLAVCLSSVPLFFLNKRWVWGRDSPTRVGREVVPFWGFTLLGLLLSTILVHVVDGYTDRTWPVLLANIAGFGVVWVSKFLFLDSVVFGRDEDDPATGR